MVSNPLFRQVAVRVLQGFGKLKRYRYHSLHTTPFRVTVPSSNDAQYEDIFLSEPNRDDFIQFEKDLSPTLRFIHGQKSQVKFPSGLPLRNNANRQPVEKDIYLTKEELLNHMFDHGYSEEEINMYKENFPQDYLFHVPELALLFDVPETDCYKYCLRVRAEDPQRGFVALEKKKKNTKIGVYGLLSVGLWFVSQSNVLGNAWLMTKTWPFFAVFFMLASRFRSYLSQLFGSLYEREEKTALQLKLDGEETLYNQIQKLQKWCGSLEKSEANLSQIPEQLKQLEVALLVQFKHDMILGMTQHLQGIERSQKSLLRDFHQMTITYVLDHVKNEFQRDATLREALIKEGLSVFAGEAQDRESLIQHMTRKTLQDIQHDPQNLLAQQLHKEFQKQLKALGNRYSVSRREATLLKGLAEKALTSPREAAFNLGNLSTEELHLLNDLHQAIFKRVGLQFLLLKFPQKENLICRDEEGTQLFHQIQQGMLETYQKSHEQQLENFLRCFIS